MSENLKIRFRLPNGEEFEAEGPQDFIESQRAYFLSLIGRAEHKPAQQIGGEATHAATRVFANFQALTSSGKTLNTPQTSSVYAYERMGTDTLPAVSSDVKHLWERLLKEENGCLILRRKTRLSVQEAALLILAGAKNLLAQTDYRAILLAKSIKLSGFEPTRLDRLLADEIKAAYIVAKGSKRSRCYTLTPEGYTKAFVMAEKRVGETL